MVSFPTERLTLTNLIMDNEEVLLPQEDTVVEEAEEVSEEVEETEAEEESEVEEEITISKAKFSAMQRKAIAYDASKKQVKPKEQNINNNVQAEELKLIARGLSDEEIEQAKVVAKGREVSLTEALKDPLFLSFQTDLKEKNRKRDAKLGASKGSSSVQATKGFQSGMSKDDHFKLWQEQNK